MKKLLFINFLLAISTAMGMTLTPILATETLGLSLLAVGLLDGLTEFAANTLRLINGRLFDYIKNKKILFISSVGMAFLSKFLILIFLNKYSIFIARLIERLANGAFASPRDAYVTTHAKEKRGLALGMLSFSKTLGCAIGPLAISALVFFIGATKDHIKLLIFITVLLTVFALMFSLSMSNPEEEEDKNNTKKEKELFDFKKIKELLKILFPLYCISFVFFLARFSDGILMLFLKKQGFPEWFYTATIAFFNISMLIFSPIIGSLIDKRHKDFALLGTITALVLFNAFFYKINTAPWLFACCGLICWGVQRTGAQIVFSYLVTQKITKNLHGTALGILAVVTAFGNLISASISGYFAQTSFFVVFAGTGTIALIALLLIIAYTYNQKNKKTING